MQFEILPSKEQRKKGKMIFHDEPRRIPHFSPTPNTTTDPTRAREPRLPSRPGGFHQLCVGTLQSRVVYQTVLFACSFQAADKYKRGVAPGVSGRRFEVDPLAQSGRFLHLTCSLRFFGLTPGMRPPCRRPEVGVGGGDSPKAAQNHG